MSRASKLAVWAVYLGVTGFVGLAVTVGVLRSSYERMGRPTAPNTAVTASDLRACLDGLNTLYVELNARLQAVPVTPPGPDQSQRWDEWTPPWRARLLALGGRCRLDDDPPPEAASLAVAYRRLGKLHGHYTTHVVQFAREIGRLADETRRALAEARDRLTPRTRPRAARARSEPTSRGAPSRPNGSGVGGEVRTRPDGRATCCRRSRRCRSGRSRARTP